MLIEGGAVQTSDQVWTDPTGSPDGLVAPEPVHSSMVAAGQYLGHGNAPPDRGSRVLAIFQQWFVPGVGLLHDGFRIAHEAGQKSGDRLQHDRDSHLASIEYVVADGVLSDVNSPASVVVGDASVVALVAAAAEYQPLRP